VWALGGITPSNLASVLHTGVAGVAVQGGLFASANLIEIEAAAQRYVAALVAIR
jgi:thiamine monophosphate synthase